MDDDSYSKFSDTFGGGLMANVISFILFYIGYIIREKCKHTKCKSHTACCDFEASEDSIEIIKKRKTESKENLLQLLKELKIFIPSNNSPRILNDVVLNAPRSKE